MRHAVGDLSNSISSSACSALELAYSFQPTSGNARRKHLNNRPFMSLEVLAYPFPLCREDRNGDRIPYTEDLAYKDFAPYVYLDGFNGDDKTRGTTNERAWEVPAGNSSMALEVILPKGCVTSECAMQAKSMLLLPTESATLKFRCARLSTPCKVLQRLCHSICTQGYCGTECSFAAE
jgi:hypothetical protein